MFDNISQWGWVAIAWGELVLAYIGYLLYINWRERQVDK